MDIEGAEYRIMEDLLDYKNKINGLVVEFHNSKSLWPEFEYIIDNLLNDFSIIHIHANNGAGYLANTKVPKLIEISFIKTSLLTQQEISSINNDSYPIKGLDVPNIKGRPDFELSF